MTAIPAGMAMGGGNYPTGLDVDPPAPQSRLSVFFRILMAVPHLIVLYFLNAVVGLLTFLAWFAILITGRYPAGLQSFTLGAQHWFTRVYGYLFLLTGTYPPFALGPDEQYAVRLHIDGQVEGRNRLTVFFRYFLAIPHIIVLAILGMVAYFVLFFAWVAALLTGRVPGGLHGFLAGILRWQMRYSAYLLLLVDDYPPFSFS